MGGEAHVIRFSQQAEKLSALAAKGLAQISDKAYAAQVRSHSHVKKLLHISLAFCGKKVALKYEQVDLSTA